MRSRATMMASMLLFSSTMFTAGPVFVGTLRSSGVVLANSIPLPDGGTVRSGDSIVTRPGAVAWITSPSHGRVEIRPDSRALLADDEVRLEGGAVASTRMPIQAGLYTIRPHSNAPNTPSWFAVAQQGGRLLVAAHRGNVTITSAGAPPVVVPEGSLAQQQEQDRPAVNQTGAAPTSQDQPSGQEQGQEQGKGKKKKKRAAAAAAGGAWTIGGLSHAASVALVVGVGAVVAGTAAGVAVSLSEESPSPSQ